MDSWYLCLCHPSSSRLSIRTQEPLPATFLSFGRRLWPRATVARRNQTSQGLLYFGFFWRPSSWERMSCRWRWLSNFLTSRFQPTASFGNERGKVGEPLARTFFPQAAGKFLSTFSPSISQRPEIHVLCSCQQTRSLNGKRRFVDVEGEHGLDPALTNKNLDFRKKKALGSVSSCYLWAFINSFLFASLRKVAQGLSVWPRASLESRKKPSFISLPGM